MTTQRSLLTKCSGAAERGCGGRRSEPPQTVGQVVNCYLRYDAPRSREEMDYFADRRQSTQQAVERAGRSAFADGKIHPHQRRIGHKKCAMIARELRPHAPAFEACRDFESLRGRVARALGSIFRDRELTVYDVTQRIGHYLRIAPDLVYLHRGVREGAKALIPNLASKRKTLRVSDLPAELHRLNAAQCEDLLCIYKDDLRRIGTPWAGAG